MDAESKKKDSTMPVKPSVIVLCSGLLLAIALLWKGHGTVVVDEVSTVTVLRTFCHLLYRCIYLLLVTLLTQCPCL